MGGRAAEEKRADLSKVEKLLPAMAKALLEHVPSRKKIASKKIIWDEKKQVFKIPGAYRAQTPKGMASGRGIAVDLDFNISKI